MQSEFHRKHLSFFAAAIVAFVVLCQTSFGQAGPLYGIANFTSGTPPAAPTADGGLYTLDTTTGAASPFVYMPHQNAQPDLAGLAYLNGTFYVSDVLVGNQDFRFGTLNPVSGLFTSINNQGGDKNWLSLTANYAAGLFYTSGDNGLQSVTPAGGITPIGAGGFFELGYDNTHGVLYGIKNSSLYTVNTADGSTQLVGSLGIAGPFIGGLAYDTVTGTLFLNDENNQSLYTVSTSTGLATLVGANGSTGNPGIEGITFLPEPASAGVVVLGAMVALMRRRHPKSPSALAA